MLDESDGDFFEIPTISPIEEVDSSQEDLEDLLENGEIAYFDNKWTLRRQMSVKAKGIPEQVIECEVRLNYILFSFFNTN